MNELTKLSHELAERAAWEARHGMLEDYTDEEVQQHWIYSARVHSRVAALAGDTDDMKLWWVVARYLREARLVVSDRSCANCGTSNAKMEAGYLEARARSAVRFPQSGLFAGPFTPRPGVLLPDGTYFCWVCSWDAAYKWLADPLLPNHPPLLPDLWRETQADYQTTKETPSHEHRHYYRSDDDDFPEFDGGDAE
jgi:hypothetical protein